MLKHRRTKVSAERTEALAVRLNIHVFKIDLMHVLFLFDRSAFVDRN